MCEHERSGRHGAHAGLEAHVVVSLGDLLAPHGDAHSKWHHGVFGNEREACARFNRHGRLDAKSGVAAVLEFDADHARAAPRALRETAIAWPFITLRGRHGDQRSSAHVCEASAHSLCTGDVLQGDVRLSRRSRSRERCRLSPHRRTMPSSSVPLLGTQDHPEAEMIDAGATMDRRGEGRARIMRAILVLHPQHVCFPPGTTRNGTALRFSFAQNLTGQQPCTQRIGSSPQDPSRR